MFPLRDHNPHFRTPLVTYGIVGACGVTWVLFQGAGTENALLSSICDWGLIPARVMGQGMPVENYFDSISKQFGLPPEGPVCAGHNNNSWLQFLSSMFMHGGWFHLIGNMWFLWIFGNNVEDSTGRFRFFIFYILCGLGAAFAQAIIDVNSMIPMVGASGAIGGVMGAYICLYPHVKVDTLLVLGPFIRILELPAWGILGYWIVIQIFSASMSSSAGGGVAFAAHVGGFVSGVLIIWLFRDKKLVQAHRAGQY